MRRPNELSEMDPRWFTTGLNHSAEGSKVPQIWQIATDSKGSVVRILGRESHHQLFQTGVPFLGETADAIEFVNDLLDVPYIRQALQFAALHCRIGGSIAFTCRVGVLRPFIDAVRQECALVFGTCAIKISETRTRNTHRLVYRKLHEPSLLSYRNDGLTLGIISGGHDWANLQRCLDSFAFLREGGLLHEVLVCGPETLAGNLVCYPWARLLPFPTQVEDVRPAICRKKNLIAQAAQAENLLIIHERIRPASSFQEVYRALEPHFEVIGCEIQDGQGNLLSGWNVLPVSDHAAAAQLGTIISDTSHNSPQHYANGSVIFCKRKVYLQYPLDERLHWGEMEDNHWYQRLWLEGVAVTPVAGLVMSDVSTSLTTQSGGRWRPSGYALWHRWMPLRCHSLPQFAWSMICLGLRFFLRNAIFNFVPKERAANRKK